jgi:hypothetical protein
MQSPATQAPAGGSAAKSESTEHQTPGAMGGALKGDINGSGAAKSAQAPAQGTKPDQQLGQEKQMTPQRGAQEDKSGAQEQRGAQDEKRGTEEQRGAQDENTKSGVNADEQNAGKTKGSGGGAVQLSQTQRSKIQAVIGRSHAARATANVNFDVAVGVRVPRSVHVEVLPEDIVEIVPQFEGFDYIVVGDNILIIDPDTLEIVDVIPV